jgi:hypothetical protein
MRLLGSAEAVRGSAEAVPVSAEAVPGSAEAVRGRLRRFHTTTQPHSEPSITNDMPVWLCVALCGCLAV